MPTTQVPATEETRFWMVHANGGGPPRKKYRTIREATVDAIALAEIHGKKFFVLELIGTITVQKEAEKPKE